ncbi:hypothetical protein OAF98_00330 [Planctomicrobium sp.]|jgi:hypothetical protein|nr:hypothetical protein [Planctomicrobium sp.]MBT5018070.1 hypothetical protein [Planctomicrobium sp.]MDB4742903.1 hypothetical protein [Planctomicrobium sp.]
MIQFRKIRVQTIIFSGLLFAFLSQSGCAKSPSDLLIGRWFADEMTIRFREDSAVIWNSRRGLAKGRYEFSGKTRRIRTEKPEPNLFLDIIVNDEREQVRFEATFIGQDRLRIDWVSTGNSRSRTSNGLVMKRANDSTLGGNPVQVAQR